MKTIYFIRHAMTDANAEKRYIGRTDVPLNDLGKRQAADLSKRLPNCGAIFSSPLIRCIETAEIIFPNKAATIIEDLCECDFGIFEGKTANELSDNIHYNNWLNSFCTCQIPCGEHIKAFKDRSVSAFENIMRMQPECSTSAFVTHGGCIMAILERFALPYRSFFDYNIGICQYALCRYDGKSLAIGGDAL